MIYVDISVVLAQILAEDHRPPARLWNEIPVASRFMEYEIWPRLIGANLPNPTVRRLAYSSGESRCWSFPHRCLRVRWMPPTSVRTLDALHLASCEYLRNQGQSIALASYDGRMTALARAMNIPIFDLDSA